MIFKKNRHDDNLYNTLLSLSRNIFFYEKIQLPDNFETRIYLMFVHFSIFMIIHKKKNSKFNQQSYDNFFYQVEYNIRELGYGDVAVNKKMKDLNKILYDILLKLDLKKNDKKIFKLNNLIIEKYFTSLKSNNNEKKARFSEYLDNFYNFCFELSLDNMIEGSSKFKN